MNAQAANQQYPLRKPVRTVAGKWAFVDADAFASHTKGFGQTVERNVPQAHSTEFEVYAILPECRVLIACVDPLAITQGKQIFVPDVPLC